MRQKLIHITKCTRKPQPENKVPFKEILPLKLKNRVSAKSEVGRDSGCLYEMTLLLACLSENEFENKYCEPQITQFQTCFKRYSKDTKLWKEMQFKEVPLPNAKYYTHKQISYFLRKYPNV